MACFCRQIRGFLQSSEWRNNMRYTVTSWNVMRTTHYSTKKLEDKDDLGPVKFSTSKAATWKAEQTRSGGYDDDSPQYQPIVVSLSLAVFLLYFCVFREENDIDEELSKPLFDRIEGLKAKQLEIALKYNRDHGLPTADLERELQALGISVE